MDADRCVSCGVIIPEGTQVCINCMSRCNECGWNDKYTGKARKSRKAEMTNTPFRKLFAK